MASSGGAPGKGGGGRAGGGAKNPRLVAEVDLALTLASDVRAFPDNWQRRGAVEYFYREGHILVPDKDLDRVEKVVRSVDDAEIEDRDNLFDGVTALRVTPGQARHIPGLVQHIDDQVGIGVATPDHAFVVTGAYPGLCPATEPEVVLAASGAPAAAGDIAPWPPVGDPCAGRDVLVSVVDTGLIDRVQSWAPWLKGAAPNDPKKDVEDPDMVQLFPTRWGADGFADPYSGHGTFIAGVVKCVAPAAEVYVDGVIDAAGLVTETQLLQQMDQALNRGPDVINLSAGGYTKDNVPSLAFRTLWEQRLSHLGGTVLVAAAGNDSRRDPFWPAAFPWCVGVGSMSRDGLRRSAFSNYGAWVDVYAPGEELVNAYSKGLKYKSIHDPNDIRDTTAGIVRWSGTSFSTPIVTGLIAARMSRTGETARLAADALLVAARGQFRPGVGPRLFP